MIDLLIIGAGGFAREAAWLVEDINLENNRFNLIGFVDEDPAKKGRVLNGYPVLGGFADLKGAANKARAVCAVGSPKSRLSLVEKARRQGLSFTSLIHPGVRLSRSAAIGEGSIICAGCIMTVDITVGEHVILNLSCTVGHDAVIGSYTTVLPAANISGCVSVAEGCLLGTNCSIIEGIHIGKWSMIGAAAAVVRDIPDHCTAVGVPAVPIKFHGGGS